MKKFKIKRIKAIPKVFNSNLESSSDSMKSDCNLELRKIQSEINSKMKMNLMTSKLTESCSSIENSDSSRKSSFIFDFESEEFPQINESQNSYDLFSLNELSNNNLSLIHI